MTATKIRFRFLIFPFLSVLLILSLSLTVSAKNMKKKKPDCLIRDKVVEMNGKKYYFSKSGKRKTGWIEWKKHKYYFDRNSGEAKTGVQTIGGNIYLFRENGTLITKPRKRSFHGKTYYLDDEARAHEVQKGFFSVGAVKKQGIDRCKRLMIVAHPDDETYWGGVHLMRSRSYFVVCLTNGDNPVRTAEFKRALSETGNCGIIWNYPDRVNGEKSDGGGSVKPMIRSDLYQLFHYKKWEKIVTHNPEGEYGHVHHIMTNCLVTETCDAFNIRKKLYYFGKFYSPEALKTKASSLKPVRAPSSYEKKKDFIIKDVYLSQKNSYLSLNHMTPYEDWKKADAWK